MDREKLVRVSTLSKINYNFLFAFVLTQPALIFIPLKRALIDTHSYNLNNVEMIFTGLKPSVTECHQQQCSWPYVQ